MKKRLLMAFAGAAITLFGSLNASAENYTLQPSETTTIWASTIWTAAPNPNNGDVNFYDATATSWLCSQSAISDGAFKNNLGGTDKADFVGSYIVLTKIDASKELAGKNLKSATLKFTSVCTVANKNSNVQVALVGTGWDATTATWNNTNTAEILNAVAIHDGGDGKGGTNVATTPVEIQLDVTEYLNTDEDKVIAFAIYTYTAREQKITDISLEIEAIDASAAADYTIKYVDGEGNVIKSETRNESAGAEITLKDEDKASIYSDDNTKKYIYASDDSEGKTVAADGTTVVTLVYREAETWTYTLDAVDAEGNALKTLKTGTNFEAETFQVEYSTYVSVDGKLYQAGKLSSDKKGYYFNLTLSENNLSKKITYSPVLVDEAQVDNIVYLEEAEDIDGLTHTTSGNTVIRSSNGASAYAAENDVEFTKLPAGKYKLTTVIFDAAKTPSSVWTFKAGEKTILEYTPTVTNWSLATSEEFSLNKETGIILAAGGSSSQGVDFIYIQKTGEAVTPEAANIGALKAGDTDVDTKLTLTDAKITRWGEYYSDKTFIEDATGGIMIGSELYKLLKDTEAGTGKALNGTITVTLSKDYNGNLTMEKTESTSIEGITMSDAEIAPAEATLTDALNGEYDIAYKYITLKNVGFSSDNSDPWNTAYYLTSGEESIPLNNDFGIFPDDMPDFEKFNSISGYVALNYDSEWVFIPYGEYDAIVKPAVVVENIAEAKKLANGTKMKLMLNDAKVTLVENSMRGLLILLEDATAAIQVSTNSWEPSLIDETFTEAGKAANGYLYCTYTDSWGIKGIAAYDSTEISQIEMTDCEIVPMEITIAELKAKSAEMELRMVKIGKSGMKEEGYSLRLTQDDDYIEIYDMFNKIPMDETTYESIIYEKVLYVNGFIFDIGETDENDNPIYTFIPVGEGFVEDTGEADAIDGVSATGRLNGDVYSVNGVKVRKAGESLEGLTKGLYIVNGKKVVVR